MSGKRTRLHNISHGRQPNSPLTTQRKRFSGQRLLHVLATIVPIIFYRSPSHYHSPQNSRQPNLNTGQIPSQSLERYCCSIKQSWLNLRYTQEWIYYEEKSIDTSFCTVFFSSLVPPLKFKVSAGKGGHPSSNLITSYYFIFVVRFSTSTENLVKCPFMLMLSTKDHPSSQGSHVRKWKSWNAPSASCNL